MRRVAAGAGIMLLLSGCSTLSNGEALSGAELTPKMDRIFDALPATEIAVSVEGDGNSFIATAHGVYPIGHTPWPWASVTKQILTILVMRAVEDGALALDDPAARYLPELNSSVGASPTIRQLLQHRSGLRNPDDSPRNSEGVPNFYRDGPAGIAWCVTGRDAPSDEGWRYNNCDYIALGAILEKIGPTLDDQFQTRIAKPAGMVDTRFLGPDEMREFVGYSADYARRIARYGASASLVGPLNDMMRFDRALLEGKLITEASRAELWRGDPALGYMALGQWVFEAPLAGCDAPVRVVERRGGIGKYQIRNVILPDRNTAIAFALLDEDFDFGEIWTGSGPMYEALSILACDGDHVSTSVGKSTE